MLSLESLSESMSVVVSLTPFIATVCLCQLHSALDFLELIYRWAKPAFMVSATVFCEASIHGAASLIVPCRAGHRVWETKVQQTATLLSSC